MIVKNSKFLIGAVSEKQYPDTQYPEFALCGRSNVGKSSLINKIIKRKKLGTYQLSAWENASVELLFY